MATQTKQKSKPKTKTKAKAKTKTKQASGQLGYRHLPAKPKRFKKHQRPTNLRRLPDAFKLFEQAVALLWKNKKLFLGIALVYGLLNLMLVQGLSNSSEINSIKNQITKGNLGALTSSISIVAVLVGSSGNASSATAGGYQLPLLIIASLAIIWALRQVKTNHPPTRIRDAYYQGMYPLIPFILVLLVSALQLIPLAIGAAIYSAIITNSIAVGLVQHLIALLVFLLLAFWSFYMLSATIFAFYIVTLPDMTPLKALRSARELVRFRRISVFRKVLALTIILVVITSLIMVPIIVWLTALAKWVFFIMSMLSLLIIQSYLYSLYRELISE